MRLRGLIQLVTITAVVFSLSFTSAYGQRVYSYVDENGVRILTNIPPKNPDLVQKAYDRTDEDGIPSITNTSIRNMKVDQRSTKPHFIAKPAQPFSSNGNELPRVDAIIDKYADEFRLDPSLVRSMIAQESGFNPNAVSRKGAQGLMQLMPATAARIGVRDAFNPEDNIRGGMKHMRNLLDTFNNDLVLSLAAYNAGENLVQRIGRVPNIAETYNYVRSITRKYGSTKLPPLAPRAPEVPPTFRFIDENGILNLTNIPPVKRSSLSDPSWIAGGQSLQ
jgi:hypothetical protein